MNQAKNPEYRNGRNDIAVEQCANLNKSVRKKVSLVPEVQVLWLATTELQFRLQGSFYAIWMLGATGA